MSVDECTGLLVSSRLLLNIVEGFWRVRSELLKKCLTEEVFADVSALQHVCRDVGEEETGAGWTRRRAQLDGDNKKMAP